MKLQHLIYIIALCAIPVFSSAQGLSYGFRVGLNFANMTGDLEQDDAGQDIEEMKNNTGFHVGASVRYNFNERFGVKGDFMYSQMGVQRFYEGQGAQLYYVQGSNDQVGFVGIQERFVRVTNSYIEIPISVFGKFGKFEVFGGPYIGFLITSKGVGDYKFEIPSIDEEFDTDLNYNYLKDDVVDAAGIELNSEDYETFSYFGDNLLKPKVYSAYHDYTAKTDNAFRTLDFGLNAGISYFINTGLYISVNAHYGLMDVSNESYDRSYGSLNEDRTQYATRDDFDRNIAIQASVGFAF
ncbi:MAG: outer membrane beta-barrel protein [Saprospiraceae bacterium]